jgi:multiple sugar transport system permease protein
LLLPSLQVALILRTILAFQVFAVVIAISGTRAVTTVLARETFFWYDPTGYGNPNVAAVYSGLIMILSLGFALLYLRLIIAKETQA